MAPVSLVHGLQNHDELTHELVHFAAGHATDEFSFRGKLITGEDLAREEYDQGKEPQREDHES